MSDSLRLYRTIIEMIVKSKAHFHDLRCLVTFAWAIVGIILDKSVHLSKWGVHRCGEAQAASKQRQFARWLKNAKIVPAEIYKHLAQTALGEWRGAKIYLALDSSSLWDEFVLVRIALVYRGRALPLSWVVLKQKSTMAAFEKYKHILKEAAAILPKGCPVILLADRGFDDIDLLRMVRDLSWGFRIRLKKSLRVYRVSKPCLSVGRFMPAKGQALFLHKVWITDRQFGPVHTPHWRMFIPRLALKNGRSLMMTQPICILLMTMACVLTWKKFSLDDNSAGFQLESGEIRDADALARLRLVLATTTLYLVSTGTAMATLNLRSYVDTHWNRGLSHFQIGWRWIRHALAHHKYSAALLLA